MAEDLVGLSEVARILGVSRQRAAQLVRDYADFPGPVAILASGRIWNRVAVETWAAMHADRPAGRPRNTRNDQGDEEPAE